MITSYIIAGLRVAFNHSAKDCPLNDIPGFSVFEKPSCEEYEMVYDANAGANAEFIAALDDYNSSSDYKKIYEFNFEYEDILCGLCNKGSRFVFYMYPANREGIYYFVTDIEEGKPLKVLSNWEEIGGATILRFSMWMAFSMCALMNKAVAIHASTIVCFPPDSLDRSKGRAALFLGESGTGKSTHTRLYINNIEGSRLLNDDSPILKVEADGTVMAYGSPWSGKTHCYNDRNFPVAGICLLSQAPYNKIHAEGVLKAIQDLYPSFPPALMRNRYFGGKAMNLISDIIQGTKIFHLECLPDKDAALLSYSNIFTW